MSFVRCIYFLAEAEAARGPGNGFLRVWENCPVLWEENPCGMFDVPSCWSGSIDQLSMQLEFQLFPLAELPPETSVYAKVDTVIVWVKKPEELESGDTK